jgi:hypothetical protein
MAPLETAIHSITHIADAAATPLALQNISLQR